MISRDDAPTVTELIGSAFNIHPDDSAAMRLDRAKITLSALSIHPLLQETTTTIVDKSEETEEVTGGKNG